MSFFRSLVKFVNGAGGSARSFKPKKAYSKARLRFEPLEDRTLPSTLFVSNLMDSGTGSLRAQIAAAAAGDTINFDNSLQGQITLTSGELDIANNLTIKGPGAGNFTISGGNTQRVLHILPGISASISGLTIAGGNTTGFGAGIDCEGSLTLENCTVATNTAGMGGGGVAFVANNTGPASLTVTSCTFTGNGAANGGGIYSSVTNLAGHVEVTITTTDFTQNAASAAGGAIDSLDQLGGIASAGFTVTGGTFSANSAAGSGGAIASTLQAADASQGMATLSGATVQNNTAKSGGGVFSELDSSGTSQTTATLAGVILQANAATAGGGGLDSVLSSTDNGQATFVLDSRCDVTDNSAEDGGGILSMVSTSGSGTSSATFGSQISFNAAALSGGGINSFVSATGSGSASATISGAFISANTAARDGAGLFDLVTSKAGGPASTAIVNSDVADNTNGLGGFGNGGGVALTIDAQASGSAAATLSGDTITGNTMELNGGGLIADVTSEGTGAASVAITKTTVNNNFAATVGGGLSVSLGNHASGSATATLDGDTISGNTAFSSTGGGMEASVFDASSGQATMTITNTTLSANSAASLGGGIDASVFNTAAGTANLSLGNDTVSGNTASAGGGFNVSCDDSFSAGQALTSLTGSSFTGNVAHNSNVAGGFAGDGGGILASISNEGAGVSSLSLSNAQITGNQADTDGGGVMADLDSARIGAALLNVDSSTVSGNNAGKRGGGVFTMGIATGFSNQTTAGATLTNSTIAGNRAATSGAGLYFDLSSTGHGASAVAAVSGSTVSGNSAGNQGGGVYSQELAAAATTATVAMTNDTVFGNNAKLGGGWYNNTLGTAGTVGATLLSATVAFNQAATSGGGLDAAGSSAFAVRSTIVAADTAPASADVLGTFNSGGHNLIGQADGGSGWVASDQTGTAAGPLDAHFGTFGNSGGPTKTLTLLATSPAIHKGDPAGPAMDQRGIVRDKFSPTIGAVEMAFASALRVTTDFLTVPAGTGVDVTVSALNGIGRVLAGFSGTVHFSSSDGAATLPADYTFGSADAGQHVFFQGITLHTPGPQTITVNAAGVTRTLKVTVAAPIGTWTPLANQAPDTIGTMMFLPDGTVMAQGGGSGFSAKTWYRLTPDSSGSYVNGTWSRLASSNLGRLYYPSNVLPDGRVLVIGGEFTGSNNSTFTNTGEIYDPVANKWTPIANFPQPHFGDDPSALLPDGTVLAGYVGGPQTYIYNPKTNSWTETGDKLNNDRSDEETWVTLPDGSILSYNVFNNPHAQRYVPTKNQWVDAGAVPLALSDTNEEIGPAFLLPDGRVFFLGDNGRTAFYTPSTNTWTQGPILPHRLGVDDAPGAMMPNGHILFAADNPPLTGPTTLFEFDPAANTITPVLNAPDTFGSAFVKRMLMLPSGQVLYCNSSSQLYVYTPSGAALAASQPTIASVKSNGDGTFTLTGTQLNGVSEGAAYGDDAQMSSNYPLVRLTNAAGHVYYARTFGWTAGVATGTAAVSAHFVLPAGIPTGDYSLVVVANGIASAPVDFTVAAGPLHLRGNGPRPGATRGRIMHAGRTVRTRGRFGRAADFIRHGVERDTDAD
jgi:hypothetical protein